MVGSRDLQFVWLRIEKFEDVAASKLINATILKLMAIRMKS